MAANIVRLRAGDETEWSRMRQLLWPDADAEELAAETHDVANNQGNHAVFVAGRPGDGLCGMVEVSLRSTANGCTSSPVGFLEGWFVDADLRGHGVGRALVIAAEQWARSLGCTEMASDTEISNHLSQLAHAALGYEAEPEPLVNFSKRL